MNQIERIRQQESDLLDVENLTFETWRDIGEGISVLDKMSFFLTGFWILAAEEAAADDPDVWKNHTEVATKILKHLSPGQIAERKSVAAKFRDRPDLRELPLSWTHFKVVRSLGPGAAEKKLRQAAENGWDSKYLKSQVADSNNGLRDMTARAKGEPTKAEIKAIVDRRIIDFLDTFDPLVDDLADDDELFLVDKTGTKRGTLVGATVHAVLGRTKRPKEVIDV